MIISYECLAKTPHTFQHFTGVSLSEFADLYQQLIPIYQRREQERPSQRPRQRAMGGGAKYELSLQERLLMTSIWLRLYLALEVLGFLFGVQKATVSRNTRQILVCLREMGDATLG